MIVTNSSKMWRLKYSHVHTIRKETKYPLQVKCTKPQFLRWVQFKCELRKSVTPRVSPSALKFFTKCLEIAHFCRRPFQPSAVGHSHQLVLTKMCSFAWHLKRASTIVFLLPVCEAGFCQCMKGGCSICQGWAKVWVGQSEKLVSVQKNNKVGLCLCKKSSHGQPSDWTVLKLAKFTCFKYPVIIQDSCHKCDISVDAICFTSQSYHRCFYVAPFISPTSKFHHFYWILQKCEP